VGRTYAFKKTRSARQTLRHTVGLLTVLTCACLASGCSFYSSGRTLIEYPLDTLECFTECPSYTESVWLRHPEAALTVSCGPYPYALYSSMAAVYRRERRQCVEAYQQQGFVRLSRAEEKRGR